MKHILFATVAVLALGAAAAHADEAYQAPINHPIMSSPSASDRGTNSNYPLDPNHTVSINDESVLMPNNNSILQSANSMPGGAGAPAQSFVHVTQGTSPRS
jgi:hypothetical protein